MGTSGSADVRYTSFIHDGVWVVNASEEGYTYNFAILKCIKINSDDDAIIILHRILANK
jgi:hypothetical protein